MVACGSGSWGAESLTTVTAALRPPTQNVMAWAEAMFRAEPDGAVGAATAGGLGLLEDGNGTTFASRNGRPCVTTYGLLGDDIGSWWLHTACGLVRMSREEMGAWVSNPDRIVGFNIY